MGQNLDAKQIQDDELDDMIKVKEELKQFEREARWLAVARINTNGPFSFNALFKTMEFAWGLLQKPKFREAGENLFIF